MMNGEIISISQKDGRELVWAKVNSIEDFCKTMQYLIDCSFDAPMLKKFMLRNRETGKRYDAYRIATEKYGVRLRTFEERLCETITYTL